MRWMTLHYPRSSRAAAPLLLPLLLAASLTGCGSLLEVDDPTAILESELNDAQGAELLRRDVLRVLYDVSDDAAWQSGLLTDEFFFQRGAFEQPGTNGEELLDMRASVAELDARNVSGQYENWQALWGRRTAAALAKLEAYGPRAHVGEMLAIRGYAAMRLAEHHCPGFPLHTVENFKLTYGPPLSTEQALEKALAAFDAAVSAAADSARILNFARLGRARTLLHLGRFAEAGAAAAEVPTGYVYQTQYSSSIDPYNSELSSQFTRWGNQRSMANGEGGTGLAFVAANDPRVPPVPRGKARDTVTDMYAIGKYPSRTTAIVLGGWVEARLIQAEAALRADANNPQWLSILNELRRTQPGLADTTDPGTEAGRVDLVFRERAFWLYATGSRLGDLRRLVRQYNRTPESVFPVGAYWMGGNYGPITSMPLHRDEALRSPGVTGCTGA